MRDHVFFKHFWLAQNEQIIGWLLIFPTNKGIMDLFEHWVRLQNQSHGFKASFPQYVSAIWRAFPVFFTNRNSFLLCLNHVKIVKCTFLLVKYMFFWKVNIRRVSLEKAGHREKHWGCLKGAELMLNEFTAKMTQSGAIGSWLGGYGDFFWWNLLQEMRVTGKKEICLLNVETLWNAGLDLFWACFALLDNFYTNIPQLSQEIDRYRSYCVIQCITTF